MKPIRSKIWDQVVNQAMDQIYLKYRINQVKDQIEFRVWNQVGNQVEDQVRDQLWKKINGIST